MVRIVHVSRGSLPLDKFSELLRIGGSTAEVVHVDASDSDAVVAALRPGLWSAVYASGLQPQHRLLLDGLDCVELVQVKVRVPTYRVRSFQDRFVTFGRRELAGVVACADSELAAAVAVRLSA